MSVLFTQYLRPNGQKQSVTIDLNESIEKRAHQMLDHGFLFSIEELQTRMVAMYCELSTLEEDQQQVGIEVCPNGPGIDNFVIKLINDAYDKWIANPTAFPKAPTNWRMRLQDLENERKANLESWNF